MRRQMWQILCGCVGALFLAVPCAGQVSGFGPTEPFLIYEHDRPNPGIWKVKFTSSPHTATKLVGVNEGLTGVWGLTTGDGKIWWTHRHTSGPLASEVVLHSWDGNGSYIFGVKPIRHNVSGGPVEINSLGWVDALDGALYGTGPDDGWTRFDDTGNVRKVYVASPPVGNNSNSGLSPTDPVADIHVGIGLLRPNRADQLLLNRGDTWEETIVWPASLRGLSADRPIVIGSYGTGARPKIISKPADLQLSSIQSAIFGNTNNQNPGRNLAFTDLHIIAENTDRGGANGINFLGDWSNILVENCLIEGFAKNIVFEGFEPTSTRQTNMAIRRCVLVDANAGQASNGAGVFASRVDGLLIEECIFDNNGWNNPAEALSPRIVAGTAADGDSGGIVLEGEARDEYAKGLKLKIVSSGEVRTIAGSYGTHSRTGIPTGSAATVRLNANAHWDADFYNGASITIAGEGTRVIDDYSGAPGRIATLDQPWNSPTGIDDNIPYVISGSMVPRLEVDSNFSSAPGFGSDYEISHYFGNILKHNMYLQHDNTDVVVRGNVSARGSSHGAQMRTGGWADDNLFLKNPIGLLFGSHQALDPIQGVARNNAVLGTQDIWNLNEPGNGIPRGHGLGFNQIGGADAYGNIVAHHGAQSGDAIAVTVEGPIANFRIFRNVVHDWRFVGGWSSLLFSWAWEGQTYSNIRVLDNWLQQPNSGATILRLRLANLSWVDNTKPPNSEWIDNLYWTTQNSTLCANWLQSQTGEFCGTSYCPGPSCQIVQTPAPLDIPDYMTAIGLSGGLDEFMTEARLQERGAWDERFTARAVLNFLRPGVGMAPLPERSRRILYEIDFVSNPSYAIATPTDAWRDFDFGGIEFDDATGKLYGLSTRRHATDPTTAVYELDPVNGPQLVGAVDAPEMQGLALAQGQLFVVSGEDSAIHRYDISTGTLLGTIPTPLGEGDIGGTFGGAGTLFFPWP